MSNNEQQYVSRRERREMKREAARVKSPSRAGGILKKVLLWGGILGGTVLLIVGLAYLATKSSNTDISGTPDPIMESDWVKGNKDAKVEIIEYSDFQCPACGKMQPIAKKAVEEFGDKIKFAYRHFPLIQIHKNAELAAQAAEAAGLQGKFWEMHDLLFEKQSSWSGSSDAKKVFAQYAQDLGLDKAKFENGLDSKEVKQKVENSRAEAARLGLGGTPSIFINGKIIENPSSYDEFKKLINDAIGQNP